MNINMYHAPED